MCGCYRLPIIRLLCFRPESTNFVSEDDAQVRQIEFHRAARFLETSELCKDAEYSVKKTDLRLRQMMMMVCRRRANETTRI